MSLKQTIAGWLSRGRAPGNRGEQDAPTDSAQAVSRETGGGSDVDTQDRNSTTGTTESGSFVGRASGDESGDVGLSGGEARTGERADGRTGAARDE